MILKLTRSFSLAGGIGNISARSMLRKGRMNVSK